MRKYLIAIVVGVVAWGCESKESRLQGFLLKGNASLDEGDQEKALYYYREALKMDSCFVDALNNAGTVHHKARRYNEAIASYTQALTCKPGYFSGRLNRANSYYESGEYHSSLSDVEKLIQQNPDSSQVHFLSGLVLVKMANYPAAVSAFESALSHGYPEPFEARVNIASAKVFMKKYAEAKIELDEALRINDKQPQVYNSLALIAIGEKDYDEALKQADKGLAISPNEPYVLNNRGFALIQLGRLDEAEKNINESISIDPYNAWAYRNKGILSLRKKDYLNAERLLKRAKEMDPNVEDVDTYLAELRVEK